MNRKNSCNDYVSTVNIVLSIIVVVVFTLGINNPEWFKN